VFGGAEMHIGAAHYTLWAMSYTFLPKCIWVSSILFEKKMNQARAHKDQTST